ncbi:MAG: amidase family protein, partial [Janthinobacterium lividum]
MSSLSPPSAASRAFLPYPEAPVPHALHGPLAGLRFAVKDLFDVAGYPTGAGNPHVLVRSGIKTAHAPVVAGLLAAGACFVGKTVTDELAFSALGNNAHFGAPVNGAAPDRITGGSSSGSASAVSHGQCDFALGSDTGGSVRGPASHCGLYGMRPTQDRISLAGCFPLCATFDTCGFFARDAAVFQRVADTVFEPDRRPLPVRPRVLIAADLFALLAPDVRAALQPGIDAIEAAWGPAQPVRAGGPDAAASGAAASGVDTSGAAASGGDTSGVDTSGVDALAVLYQAYRVLQGWEAWQMQGERIEGDGLCLGPDVAARFAYARSITAEQAGQAMAVRRAFTAWITELCGDDAVLILPTQPDIAPLRDMPAADIEAYRNRATHLMGLAPMCGFPQVSLPFAGRLGAPLGLSLMSPAGTDRSLVARIAALAVPAGAIRAPEQVPVAAPAVPAFTGDEQRALGWYARTMSGAPVQDEDLETVAALAR